MSKKELSRSTNSTKLRMIIVGSVCLMLAILLIAYLCISQYYKEHFYAQTFINGLDCSNLTAEEAKERITESVNTYVLNVKERNGVTERISGADIDLKCTFEQDIDKVLNNQSAYSWLAYTWQDNKVENPYQLTYDESKLTKVISEMECLKKKNQVEPTNAKISAYSEDKGFTVVPEDQGCKVDKKKLISAVKTAIKNLDAEVAIEKMNCYVEPEITSEDSSIKETMNTLNKYMATKITYKFGTKTEVFDSTKIGPTIKVSTKGKVSIDEDKVEEYLKNLAKTYNTVPESRKFKTSYGSVVTVKGGDLGWELDTDTELEELLASIKKGEQKEKDPACTMEGIKYGSDSIGNTYVEINLTKQHLFYYKNGKLFFETDIVSGNPNNGHATPVGCYCVRWMQSPRVLRGPGYATRVQYWMPFIDYEGIGMHDATWQNGIFGGDRYLSNGSHGCINLSLSAAKTIYNNIEPGVPVICYK